MMECDLCGETYRPVEQPGALLVPRPDGKGCGFQFKQLCRVCRSHLYAATSVVVARRKDLACQPTI